MSQEAAFTKINKLLEDAGVPMEIRGLADLKRFLYNKNNMQLSIYDEVEELYDSLMVGPSMW